MYENPADILRKYQYRGGSKEHTHLEITYSVLANLYKVSIITVRRWVSRGKLDPSDLLDIIEKYNNRELLDKRRKQKD